MNAVSVDITRLVAYCAKNNIIKSCDNVWAANRIAAVIGCGAQNPFDPDLYRSALESDSILPEHPQALLDALMEHAAEYGHILDSVTLRDLFDTEIMASVMPRPSEIRKRFSDLYAVSKTEATDWYYSFSQATNYIRTERCAKDMRWTYPCQYGTIQISVNLSKPEKDPRAIAAALKQKQTVSYPQCAICLENEGFSGDLSHAARGSHRIIPITIAGEQWYLQYSPYVYYNEHCIAFSSVHSPMKTEEQTFVRLLDFLDLFPHYFIGSNADLPLVGGSILTHNHFQGGRTVFPMEVAPVIRTYTLPEFATVSAEHIRWPLSVLRLRSADRIKLTACAKKVLTAWNSYNDPEMNILCRSDDTQHSTVTPIARMRDGKYELDIVLRNNRTTEEYPFGLFNTTPEKHHIKRENIGLIEVMGLAVLPSRLKTELELIRKYLLNDRKKFYDDPSLAGHTEWYEMLCQRSDISEENCEEILKQETAKVFVGCLEDCGVYKLTEKGNLGFDRFVSQTFNL